MTPLPVKLRSQLEKAIKQARKIAETGARKALEALAVHEPDPYEHMKEPQRDLRKKLHAQAVQLGDGESSGRRGSYEIRHLSEKVAYDQWHRLLFSRFLIENNLLISPGHGVPVSLDDCEELAPSLKLKDAWAAAARFVAVQLPGIFRLDDPAGEVQLPAEDRKPLVELVVGLPVEVFTAGDSLGWCYQFWQAERKDEVNASGKKIGADELPAVTQLFTEDYMVDFLLDNTLGAWRAGKLLTAENSRNAEFKTEEEVRRFCALPDCPWKYLRFIKTESVSASSPPSAVESSWRPAAGVFDGWPKAAKELRCLDPCMGSGHFIVAMFERLVALRMAEEMLEESAAVAAVIRDNIFGLEIDPRCTQIAAFNLALAAWRRVGHCKLPEMNLACCGLAPGASEEEWLELADRVPWTLRPDARDPVRNGLLNLHRLFSKAPVLGSLIDPNDLPSDMIAADYETLLPFLNEALAAEVENRTYELAVTASGLAKAAEILAGQFTLVATNVPYLGRGKQDDVLKDFCESHYPDAKAELATCFVERCLNLCTERGTTALVTPQSWLSLGTYKKHRLQLLKKQAWNIVVKLGPAAFEIMDWWAANTMLSVISRHVPSQTNRIAGFDVSKPHDASLKPPLLLKDEIRLVGQLAQLGNPDARINLETETGEIYFQEFARANVGIQNGDNPHFLRCFWEHSSKGWEPVQMSFETARDFTGLSGVIRSGLIENNFPDASWHDQTPGSRGRRGVIIRHMNHLPATTFLGGHFDQNVCAIVPIDSNYLGAVWCFCNSSLYRESVRAIDQSLKVTNATLVKVPFDLAYWQKVAADKYPHGLPKPFSSDPTQWLFNGHPPGADQPLHVAVARLLGYQWPRQTGSSFPDCPALGPDGLEDLADEDGIVCLSATKGEAPAAERLRELLALAWGADWKAGMLEELLAKAGFAGKTLDDWLRNGFFEQHCALFHHRPFIWHVWDGDKNGFSALVNYHKLDRANLEKLAYAYLGDWIRRQQTAVEAGEPGSDARLQAAKQLQARLKLILAGEPPFDLFVRWKPLAKQAIGWNPDLNDGVRMNIRPFLAADIPGGKKGAGILRTKPNIKWEKDRGKEPERDKKEFPWFWNWDEKTEDFKGAGTAPDGNRWNNLHYTNDFKKDARDGVASGGKK